MTGSVMFSETIPKRWKHKDVSELSDDNNPGAFNAFKHCGKGVGTVCLFLDILKGFVPVLLASLLGKTNGALFVLAVIAPVLGHALGMFNRFRGGKCIAVSFGVTLGIVPVTFFPFALLAALYIAFSTVFKINPNRVRSIIVYALFGIVSCVFLTIAGLQAAAVGCALVALTVTVKHLKPIGALKEKFNRAKK